MLVALLGWLIPGAGYIAIGQRARGLTVGIPVLVLFIGGLWIGGLRAVELPPTPTPMPPWMQEPVQSSYFSRLLGQRPWFLGQVWAGPIAFVPPIIKQNVEAPLRQKVILSLPARREDMAKIVGNSESPEGVWIRMYNQRLLSEMDDALPAMHSRMFDIGTLYAAIAGMLNLLAVIDSGYRAGHRRAS
jgi:hypothetical protein